MSRHIFGIDPLAGRFKTIMARVLPCAAAVSTALILSHGAPAKPVSSVNASEPSVYGTSMPAAASPAELRDAVPTVSSTSQPAGIAAPIELVVKRNDAKDSIFRRLALDQANLAAIRQLPELKPTLDPTRPADGETKDVSRKAFLRTPVEFTRVSSGFNPARRHPLLNLIRGHMGTDYAAPIGTPVHAAGDGRVCFMGTRGGYGNAIVLTHRNSISTLYGHLSRFARNIHAGARVRRGEIIGYVGMTGLATGPHLHYEFLLHGAHMNPQTVRLPIVALASVK